MTLAEAVERAAARLRAAGLSRDEAAFDAELLARHVLGWDRARYFAERAAPPPPGFAGEYERLIARRARREPAAYIVGHREFWGLDFVVSPAVLIPRPETELLVEEAATLARATGQPFRHIVDAGTGCGCLAVCLAQLFPTAQITATDRSSAALEVARHNARRHGVTDRIRFLEGEFVPETAAPADLIVSNPPYIAARELASLPPEVREYEPLAALVGGEDGLAAINQLLTQAPRHLTDEGWLIVEFGAGQAPAVQALAASHGLQVERVRADLQGQPRVAVLRHRGRCVTSAPCQDPTGGAKLPLPWRPASSAGSSRASCPRRLSTKTRSSWRSTTSTRRRRCMCSSCRAGTSPRSTNSSKPTTPSSAP